MGIRIESSQEDRLVNRLVEYSLLGNTIKLFMRTLGYMEQEG